MVSLRPLSRRTSAAALAPLAVLLLATLLPAPRVAAASRATLLDADRYIRKYEMVSIDPADVARKVRGSGLVTIEAGTETYELELEPRDLRAPDYRAEETLEDGTTRELSRSPIHTYAGRVLGANGGTARFTIDEGQISGIVVVGDERVFVEPLRTFSLASGPTDYLVYKGSDIRPEAEIGACDITEAQKVASAIEGVAGKVEGARDGLTLVRLATEADNEFVDRLGSAAAANNEILSIMNQVDGVFEAEVGITFQVVIQNTYAGADPYSPTTSASGLLSEFRTTWEASRTNVARDVAHLWTGKELDGSTIGLAYIGVVCRAPSHAYGLSQYNASVPQRYVLTAHELGHNLGACHTDSDCDTDPAAYSSMTIMRSVIGPNLVFSPFSLEQITTHVATYGSCLGTVGAPPPATPAAPRALSATRAGARVQLQWLDDSSNEEGFVVEQSQDGVTFEPVVTLQQNVTSFESGKLKKNPTFYFRVRAFNAVGSSDYSNTAEVRKRQ